MSEFTIRDLTDIDLEGGTLIECFPTNSPLALVTANALLESFSKESKGESSSRFDQIAVGDSYKLPSISLVYYEKPKFPIRIYANPKLKIALLVSEIPQYPPITREIGKVIFDWTKEKKISRIISIEGFEAPQTQQLIPSNEPYIPQVFGVGTTDSCRALLEEKGIPRLHHGVIKGLSAILLNEGWFDKRDVIVLLGEVLKGYPGIRTAHQILKKIELIIPELQIDEKLILKKAEEFEQMALSMQNQAESAIEEPTKPKPGTTYI